MTKTEMAKAADELDEMATRCEAIMTELQDAFNELSEAQQGGAKGEAIQTKIDLAESAMDALVAIAAELEAMKSDSIDFGDKLRFERDGKLYMKALPEDVMPGVTHYVFERFQVGYIAITQVNDSHDEVYSDEQAVFVPARIWKAAMEWLGWVKS